MHTQERHNDATPNRPFGDRPIDAPMVLIDLPAYLQQIQHEASWYKNDRNAITVFKNDVMSHVLVALRADAIMEKEAAEGMMSIQVLAGRLHCAIGTEQTLVEPAQIVTIASHLPYEIKALEHTSFLLTMTAPVTTS